MKTPPFLLLAALLFWGQQSGFLLEGAIMGVILEGARFFPWRWELEDTDFNRIWTFCVLLVLLLAAYVFTNNDEGGGFTNLIHGHTTAEIVNSSAVTGTRFLRWLPMITFVFLVAQVFNVRDSVPLTAVSLVLAWRRRKGEMAFAGRYINLTYPYFVVILFAAGIHTNNSNLTYFCGAAVLLTWALWSLRTRRFSPWVWSGCLIAAIGLGFFGQFGIGLAQAYIQNFNAQWMSRFVHPRTDPTQSITAMGDVGSLKLSAEIVIWLEPQEVGRVPAYLRENTYRIYQPVRQTWYAGIPLTDFDFVPSDTNGTTWTLIAGNTNHVTEPAKVNIACFLNGWSLELGTPEGLLPLPSGTRRLENTPDGMNFKLNRNGAVLAAGRGLLFFDAIYAHGATVDEPPDSASSTNRLDLLVPPIEKPALDQVIAEMNIPTNADLTVQMRAINRFFVSKFAYSIWQGEDKDKKLTNGPTPLTRFLLTSRSGHCEYFATATVLLLRELGVPARYAVGYAVHEPHGTGYVVRERDSHAWCLVWNESANSWEDFDTTPPSWVAVENQRTSFLEWFADFKSWLRFEFAAFRWRQAHLQQYIFWALTPVMVVLLYHIIFRRRGKLAVRVKGVREDERLWPGLDSEFYQLEKKLAALGLPRPAGEPLTVWLEHLSAGPVLVELRAPLQKILRLHYRHRFDPQGLGAAEREQLRSEVKKCAEALPAARS